MNPQIVKDTITAIIDDKIYKLKNRGVIVANYDELVHRLTMVGYYETEIQHAIVDLRKAGVIRTGKYQNGKGWLREIREMDKTTDEDGNNSQI
ncbi:MAG: hypothetical protein NC226_09630 [Bacteroides cellulosilyticus]|nr:hypothetical protein [Bacteroides cellulosilyticus]